MGKFLKLATCVFVCSLLFLGICLVSPETRNYLQIARSEIWEYVENTGGFCFLRKSPVVLLHGMRELFTRSPYSEGQFSLRIVWEMSCDATTQIGISSFPDHGLIKDASVTAAKTAIDRSHYVHHREIELIRSHSYYFRLFVDGKPITKNDTLGSSERNLTLAIISDNQSGVRWFRTQLSALSAHQPLVLFHFGDSVQKSRTKEWQFQWFEPLTYLNTLSILHQPIVAMLRGNHDMGNNYFDIYVHPSLWFGTTVAGVRFVFLHFLPNPAQTKWLLEELKSDEWKKAKLRVVVTHIPPYIEYWHPQSWINGEKRWGDEFKEHLLPILKRNSVDIIMGGHAHLYQRGKGSDNVTYVIVGGGGGELEKENERVANYQIYDVTYFGYHHLIMTMTQSAIYFDTYNIRNNLIDQFIVPFAVNPH